MAVDRRKVSIEPKSFVEYEQAVRDAGAELSEFGSDVAALVWTDYARPDALADLLKSNPQIEWVQLPFAGVDAFADILKHPVKFTSAKGSYREPVAEHALALCLALARKLPERVTAKSWGKKFAVSLYDSHVVIVGGGGITEELLLLLAPFKTRVSVVRKHAVHLEGATETVGFDQLDNYLSMADFVILAAALTDETLFLMDDRRFELMKPTAYLVNIARGKMVDQQALVRALEGSVIAGAATDVTYPEPLPDGHELWDTPNLIVTPHTADTNAQVIRLFCKRIDANVKAWLGQSQWVGEVDPNLGY
jgi:phosphoglycerate dehydrogenase-like enzyme